MRLLHTKYCLRKEAEGFFEDTGKTWAKWLKDNPEWAKAIGIGVPSFLGTTLLSSMFGAKRPGLWGLGGAALLYALYKMFLDKGDAVATEGATRTAPDTKAPENSTNTPAQKPGTKVYPPPPPVKPQTPPIPKPQAATPAPTTPVPAIEAPATKPVVKPEPVVTSAPVETPKPKKVIDFQNWYYSQPGVEDDRSRYAVKPAPSLFVPSQHVPTMRLVTPSEERNLGRHKLYVPAALAAIPLATMGGAAVSSANVPAAISSAVSKAAPVVSNLIPKAIPQIPTLVPAF